MSFKRYESIDNLHNRKYLEQVELLLFRTLPTEWIATEKIHGANFSIWRFDEVRFGKRSNFINESFYGYERIADTLREQALKLPHGTIIYGEYAGGSYPGVRINGAVTVQQGVYYSPDNIFLAFDAMENGQFASYDRFCELCDMAGFMRAPLIRRGPFEDIIKTPNEFNSLVPGLLGLQPLENNTCEGIVIKPIEPLYLPSGDRVILKSKNEKFSEIKNGPKEKIEEDPALLEHLEKVQELINDNRLDAAASKVGELCYENFGRILQEMVRDVLSEYPAVENKRFAKHVGTFISNLMKKRLGR